MESVPRAVAAWITTTMPNIYDVTTETLRQDVIEALIRHTDPTASEIADYLDCYYEDVEEVLEQLRDDGMVCKTGNDIWSDYETTGGFDAVEEAVWRYCGGPISEALRVA